MNEDTLVGPQVAKVKQHHIGSDVVDREGCCLLKAHALWDEEGVVCRHHRHLLPQPEAVQHHHLITDLEQKTHAVWGGDTGKKNVTEPNAVIPNQGWLFCFGKECLCVDTFICVLLHFIWFIVFLSLNRIHSRTSVLQASWLLWDSGKDASRAAGTLRAVGLLFYLQQWQTCKYAAASSTRPPRVCSRRLQANKESDKQAQQTKSNNCTDFMEGNEEGAEETGQNKEVALFNRLDIRDWCQTTIASPMACSG